MNIYIVKEGSAYEPEQIWPECFNDRIQCTELVQKVLDERNDGEKWRRVEGYWQSSYRNFVSIQELKLSEWKG